MTAVTVPVACRELPKDLVERIGAHVERIATERAKRGGAVILLCRRHETHETLELAEPKPFYAWLVKAGGDTDDVRARVASYLDAGALPLVCVQKVTEKGQEWALFEVYPLRIAPLAKGGDA